MGSSTRPWSTAESAASTAARKKVAPQEKEAAKEAYLYTGGITMLDESMIPYAPRKPRSFLPGIPVPMVKMVRRPPSIPSASFIASKCQAASTHLSTNVKSNARPFLTRSTASKITKNKSRRPVDSLIWLMKVVHRQLGSLLEISIRLVASYWQHG